MTDTNGHGDEGAPAPAVDVREVSKSFVGGDGRAIQVLDGADLRVQPGETVAIIGQSGVGKSTLLHLIGGLDRPDAGEVSIGGESLRALTDERLSQFRNRSIGFVFQFHHLLREFSAIENVMMPLLIAGLGRAEAEQRAVELLREVGLQSRVSHKPAQLSGGEQQRVAVARALVTRPRVVLADEPSGNLDPATGARLHDLLFVAAQSHRAAMVLVTHNLELAARADRLLRLEEGRLHHESAYAADARGPIS